MFEDIVGVHNMDVVNYILRYFLFLLEFEML